MAKKKLIDLETHFAVFRAHHSHTVNALLHALFICPIELSLFMLFHLTPPFVQIPILGQLDLNLAFVLALVFGGIDLLMDRKAGFLAAILWFICFIGSGSLVARFGFSLSFKFALATFLFGLSWTVVGHGVFEKQAPANSYLPQVFFMESFFIFLEVLHKLFNYEPYPGFYTNVDKKIEANLKQWQTTKLKKID
ncbi:hypothetical protein LUZ60_003116 [Juncus effusus]|nr:hypothetical protein LUZ60_003116 [Juncus effusus]